MRPPVRTTHTVAELEVSPAAYDEVAGKLRAARYDHCLDDGVIDMGGIGLTRGPERPARIWPVLVICLSMAVGAVAAGLIIRMWS